MQRLRLRTAAALVTAVVTLPAFGQGFAWMQNSPVRSFTEADWNMVSSTLHTLLETGENGDTASWDNPDSTASGAMEVLDRTEVDGAPCRRARITNNGGGLSSTGVFRLCRSPAGEWKFSPP